MKKRPHTTTKKTAAPAPLKKKRGSGDRQAAVAPAELRNVPDLIKILARGFDTAFYREQLETPDVEDPIAHYLTKGWLLGLNPCPEFSTAYYLDANPDVRDSQFNPFFHYLVWGRAEGRRGLPAPPNQSTPDQNALLLREFEAPFYRGQLDDSVAADADLLSHYLAIGWKQGLNPTAWFSTTYYLEANPDVREMGINPFLHFVCWGRQEGRIYKPDQHQRGPRRKIASAADAGAVKLQAAGLSEQDIADVVQRELDAAYYLKQLGTDAVANPVSHYIVEGWLRGLNPSPDFSTAYYLETNPDVREARINPFFHFLVWGRKEGRRGRPTQGEALGVKADSTAGAEADSDPADDSVVRLEFDAQFYRGQLGEAASAGTDLLAHYFNQGWKEGLDPSRSFSTSYYLESNPDVKKSGINPFQHFIHWGQKEGRPGKRPEVTATPENLTHDEARRLIAAEFDAAFYLEKSPDLRGSKIDLLNHFLKHGWKERRDPSPGFSTAYYLNTHTDIRKSGLNPFVHYVGWGRAEGRKSIASGAPAPVSNAIAANRQIIEKEFDSEYYLRNSPDLRGVGIDCVDHYLNHGWRELRDPSAEFSTAYYLEANPDIKRGGGNPFVHFIAAGRREGRNGLPFRKRIARKPYQPFVTVIVPNFNHARFLHKRIDSILAQTYQKFELLLLDDCSTDESRDVITQYAERSPERIRVLFNDLNSGNVFVQWKKGIESARGELIWICESDDFCESDFLEKCIRPLADPSVMIGFGRIQFADGEGKFLSGLDSYREQAEPGIWSNEFCRPASEWFRGSFAVSNLIPNVGGCVFRAQKLPPSVWNELLTYRISGDWYLYSELAAGGQLAYVPDAVAYFRQHQKNTSVVGTRRPNYYIEHQRIVTMLRERWGTPDDVALRCYLNVYNQYQFAKARQHVGPLSELYSNDAVLRTEKKSRHVLMAFLGFHLGGGELFPIHLANQLMRDGYTVSMLCLDSADENQGVRRMLDPRIAVYDCQYVAEVGVNNFLARAGVDLIHSHSAGIEYFFFNAHRIESLIPYVVTLHGSYEVTPFPEKLMERIQKRVTHWVYLADKNLAHLQNMSPEERRITFIGNGMPDDAREFGKTRAELGIGKDDLVFVIASRAIKEKGWRSAIRAMLAIQSRSKRKMHLLLCGSGPEAEAMTAEFGDHKQVHLLGFQDRINGIYRLADVVMLPSRFAGESFPLTLIQAMQVGKPTIATDIGEIRSMLIRADKAAGLVIPLIEDDLAFETEIAEAMLKMANAKTRGRFARHSAEIGIEYAMDKVAAKYQSIYDEAVKLESAAVDSAAPA